jgi:hypothetical protein
MSRRAVLWSGLAAFVLLCAWCVAASAPRIELDLESRSGIALLTAGLPLDEVVFDGRDATLSRSLATPEYAERAAAVLRRVRGIRRVTVGAVERSATEGR